MYVDGQARRVRFHCGQQPAELQRVAQVDHELDSAARYHGLRRRPFMGLRNNQKQWTGVSTGRWGW